MNIRRSILGSLAATVLLVSSGAAWAGPCDNAERGTYLSNVCWLVEEFSKPVIPYTIIGVNEKECTVTLNEPLWNPRFRTSGDTIYFNRSDFKTMKIEWNPHATCWHLSGNGINGEGFDNVTLCGGRVEGSRVKGAFDNLYTKYCEGSPSEF